MKIVELGLDALDLKYAGLRGRNLQAEKRLLISLGEVGQQSPVIVVAGAEPGRYVLIDGRKRVRALRRLKADVVKATVWEMSTAQALVSAYQLQDGTGWNAMEVGKSGLSSAIVLKALYAGKRGLAITAHALFDALKDSHADRTTRAFLQRLARLDVLLVDEFGYLNAPEPQQINGFFRIMDDRCSRKSTIITTNLGFEEWGKFLGNVPLVAALLSRLLQNCRTIDFPKDAVNLRNPKLGLPATAPRPAILNAA